MKTPEQINSEIEAIKAFFKDEKGKIKRRTQKEITATNKQIRLLLQYKSYLETDPRESFVESELARIENIITIYDSRYDQWLKNTPKALLEGKDERKFYESMHEYSALKNQIKTLKYLLDK